MALNDSIIEKIGLFVTDYSRSLRFYQDVLDLKLVWESSEDRNAGFRVGSNLLIIQEDEKKVEAGGARIYFTVEDASLTSQKLETKGLIIEETRDLGFAIFVDFADPDGNRLALFQPSDDYRPQIDEYLS